MSPSPRTLGQRIHALLAVLGLSVLAILGLEVGSRIALWLGGDVFAFGSSAPEGRDAVAIDLTYDLDALLREQESLPRPAYEPYVLWRARPFRGRYFNVDRNGHRVTSESPADSAPTALHVWMLGGSTMFGYGAPDDQTIPSHVARNLKQQLPPRAQETDHPIRVRNLGQGGYVSTQEALTLLLQLRTVKPGPDVVIFYDGYNDAVAMKSWPNSPGSHFQVDRIRSRFEGALSPAIHSSGMFRLVERLARRIAPTPDAPTPEEARRLGDRAAELWLDNVELVRALADRRGFRVLFFLQPAHDHSVLEAMGQAIRSRLESAESRVPSAGIYDLSGLFRGEEERFFLDTVHLTGPGNARVARRITGTLSDELCRRPLRRPLLPPLPCPSSHLEE